MQLYREDDIIMAAFNKPFVAVTSQTWQEHDGTIQRVLVLKGHDEDLAALKRRWDFMGEEITFMQRTTLMELPALPLPPLMEDR